MNRGRCLSNFAGDKRFTSSGTFMIKQDAVRCMKLVRLAIVDRNPICKKFGRRVWAAGIERCHFALRRFQRPPVEFRSRRLVETNPILQAKDSHAFEKS